MLRIVLLSVFVTGILQGSGKAPAGPTLQFREASGCNGLVMYTWNDARTEVLVIRIDHNVVTIKDGSTTIDLGPNNPGVTAELQVADVPRESFPYCEEGATVTDTATTWRVLSGRLKVLVKRRPQASFTPVSVGVERLVVQAPDGTQVRQRRDIQFTAAISDLK